MYNSVAMTISNSNNDSNYTGAAMIIPTSNGNSGNNTDMIALRNIIAMIMIAIIDITIAMVGVIAILTMITMIKRSNKQQQQRQQQ